MSRIVYICLGVVCLHLAALWLVQVGSQPVAPVMPTFLVQMAPAPLSNSATPTSPSKTVNLPSPEVSKISQKNKRVRVLITKDGSARQGEVLQSSGFDRLDQAALRAVMGWRYVPGQRAGVPQDMWFNVPINFALK